ncbi:hypothetical protein OW763_13820 [Clostridium aestuarii]|uniref:Uncharacterized protein n=1 Tax=Clostridium aestuarii TaxID=338193 RepID=A0ABT4D2F2_9CLOT|nr:hypothetical protein [Clostridium aestuarii]MCY6485409.1 hypothetical protein [Clostridium aestuarii]
MKKNKILIINLVLLFILISVYLYTMGYRLTEVEAAKVHLGVGKNAQLFEQVNYKWGTVCLFNTPKGPRTAIAEKYMFLWKTRVAFHMTNSQDLIKTVGWANNEKCTVYAVESTDDNLAYIEMGSGSDRIKIYSEENEPMIFQWSKPIRWNDFNGIAYSKNGEAIYEFRYPKGNVLNISEIRWFPIK